MEDYASFVLLGNWALLVSYLCFRFHTFDRFFLEKYIFQVEGGAHLFQSCICEARDNLPFVVMHPSFESLVVTNTLSL